MDRAEAVRRLLEVISSASDRRIGELAQGLKECQHCDDRCMGIARCERFQAAVRAASGGAEAMWKKSITEALRVFHIDCGRFPTEAEGLAALLSDPGIPGWQGPYWSRHTASVLSGFDYTLVAESDPDLQAKESSATGVANKSASVGAQSGEQATMGEIVWK